MSWMHDTGHAPAHDHEGGVVMVVEDGTDPARPPDQIGPRVIGWRPGCQCGWHSTQLQLRSRWPDDAYAHAPEAVEERCRSEWKRHLHAVLPGLAIHDPVGGSSEPATTSSRRPTIRWAVSPGVS